MISDTVRGLMRTSGLPSMVEREGIQLKGIVDAPRIYALDWRRLEFMSAGEDVPARSLLPTGRARILLAGVAIALIRDRMDPTVRSLADVTDIGGAPVLANMTY